MKKWQTIIILVTCTILLMAANPALAADLLLDRPIDSLTFQPDKNGQMYGRAIVTMEFDLDGHKYTKGVPVMAFGEKTDILRSYNPGDQLRAVVSQRDYNGAQSYTIQSFIRD
jgi:hypothetical protein